MAATILKNSKSRYVDNGLTNRREIWHNDAIRHLWCVPQLELCNFKNPTWRPPPFREIEKSPCDSFSDFNEIWHGNAVRPSWPFGPLQIWDLKKSKMAAAGILTTATVWPICTALGMITHIGPPNQACYLRKFVWWFLCVRKIVNLCVNVRTIWAVERQKIFVKIASWWSYLDVWF